jgi:hypothetical protein
MTIRVRFWRRSNFFMDVLRYKFILVNIFFIRVLRHNFLLANVSSQMNFIIVSPFFALKDIIKIGLRSTGHTITIRQYYIAPLQRRVISFSRDGWNAA